MADARDSTGELLPRVRLDGPDPYDRTARMIARAAVTALSGGRRGVGAHGPVAAFGLDELMAGAALAGLDRVEPA